jgi:hypothetical protein
MELEWTDITEADRRAPREGTPIEVLVSVSYRVADDPKCYYALVHGKRWPTGAGTWSKLNGWIDVKALSWRPYVDR